MALTIADTRIEKKIGLNKRRYVFTIDTIQNLDINFSGKFIELHHLWFSADITTSYVKLGQLPNFTYLILKGGGTTAIYYDFSLAPLIFRYSAWDLFVDPGGVLVDVIITLWYRLI